MPNKKDGGSAFPIQSLKQTGEQITDNDFNFAEGGQPGITVRDYFAARAMQGMMIEFIKEGYPENIECKELTWMVNASWLIADAMLEAREK